MIWETYDTFEENELNEELWRVETLLPPEKVGVEVKDGMLILAVSTDRIYSERKPSEAYSKKLGVWDMKYVGEALRVIAKHTRFNGVEACFIPYLDESYGEGNVQLRCIGKNFCYMAGINFKYDVNGRLENSDVFIHLWDRELNSYPDGGRLHIKDILPSAKEISLGSCLDREFWYGVGRRYFKFPVSFEEVLERLREDSIYIHQHGLESFELKIDVYAKRPCRIKAAIPYVRVRREFISYFLSQL